jgi:hypothetical protein
LTITPVDYPGGIIFSILLLVAKTGKVDTIPVSIRFNKKV